jgi:hypothetical protein
MTVQTYAKNVHEIGQGARYLMEENLKVVWAEFFNLS